MKYFIDTEFHEGFHKPFLGKNRHFIDLISIGIVAEDGREYYAISKDFDLKAAWNKYDQDPQHTRNYSAKKVYWLRDNVLRQIWRELEYKSYRSNNNDIAKEFFEILDDMPESERVDFYSNRMQRANWFSAPEFTLKRLTELIKKFGKSNKQIAEEIKKFVYPVPAGLPLSFMDDKYLNPAFYGYYADYDWVVFCSLFGRMIDLPKGFPMYCKDLKQMLDEKQKSKPNVQRISWSEIEERKLNIDDAFKIKKMSSYPKQENEHNALADAKWNKQLYNFLTNL